MVSQKQRATQKQITVVNINTALQRRRRSNAVSAPPPPVFRGGYQPPPPPPIIPLPPPPDLYETNRLRERVAKLERVNVVNRMPLKPPVKSAETQTAGVVRDRTEGRRARIEAAAAELLNPTVPIEQVGSETFAEEKERQRQRRVRLVEDRIVDIDEETGGAIRPPSPPPPPPVADPLASPTGISRATTEDIRGNERLGTERIVKDHRGSFRDLRERKRSRDKRRLEEILAEEDEPTPRVGGIRGLMARVGGDVMDRRAALKILED